MSIWLGTYLNLTYLTILNENFYSYQLCTCNYLSDITKFFVLASALVKVNYFYLFFHQIGSLTNWLANEFVLSNYLLPNCCVPVYV